MSVTFSAECNKEGATSGSVDATRESTSMNLRAEVVWNSDRQMFMWHQTLTEDNDISVKCEVRGSGVSASSTDVTLQFSCFGRSSDGGTAPAVHADLPLNAELTVGSDGRLAVR